MENIEERPIQEVRGSYILYLPKEWCSQNNLSKGSRVRIRYSGSRLVIEAPSGYEKEEIVIIHLDKISESSLNYILISLYLLGIDKIRIISKRNIGLKDRRFIREIIEKFTKYLISYEGKNFLELRSGYSELNIWELLFKAFNSLESILNHFLEILSTKGRFEYIDIEEIEAMDSEVDFLRRDLERIHSRSLLSGCSDIDLKTQEILVRIAVILERIVDHLNSLARLSVDEERNLESLPDYIAKLRSVVNYLTEIISSLRNSYMYGKHVDNAQRILDSLVNIIEEKNKFHAILKSDVGIDLIKYHILRLYDYITDITELLIDWTVKTYYVDYSHMFHIE